MEETKILNKLTKYVPETVAERILYLTKLAEKNNILSLFTSMGDYVIDLNLIVTKEVTVWTPELITINLNDITTEAPNIERTEQITEYTEEELEMFNKLVKYLESEHAQRIIYLMRLAKENDITYLFASLYEGNDQYIRVSIHQNWIKIYMGEEPPLNGKYQSTKEWLDEMDRNIDTRITIFR